LFGDEDV
jgi:hypothetical protein